MKDFFIFFYFFEMVITEFLAQRNCLEKVSLHYVARTIVKWACSRKEFLDLKIDVLHNWGARMKMSVSMKKKKKKVGALLHLEP